MRRKTSPDSKRFLMKTWSIRARSSILCCAGILPTTGRKPGEPASGGSGRCSSPAACCWHFFTPRRRGPTRLATATTRGRRRSGDAAHRSWRRKEGGPAGVPLTAVFNNRNIENLFRDFAHKILLARDNVREVLVVRCRKRRHLAGSAEGVCLSRRLFRRNAAGTAALLLSCLMTRHERERSRPHASAGPAHQVFGNRGGALKKRKQRFADRAGQDKHATDPG